jgi:hypothetical protein
MVPVDAGVRLPVHAWRRIWAERDKTVQDPARGRQTIYLIDRSSLG